MPELASVNVFQYTDYRAALRDLYAAKKALGHGFSYRAFSRRAGLRSTNFLKLVMDGKRNLSGDAARRFAYALGLTGAASDYFCELVSYNQASDSRERARCHERLVRLRPERALRELGAHQAAYHASWYIPAIRELVARPDFREDPAWIARTLVPRITANKARDGLVTLLSLGLLIRDQKGKLAVADPLITTGLEPLGHHVAEYHRAMLQRASESIDLFSRELREIGSLTLCIDENMLPVLKARLQAFRREILQDAERVGTPQRVVQLNFQLFPLSQGVEVSPPVKRTVRAQKTKRARARKHTEENRT